MLLFHGTDSKSAADILENGIDLQKSESSVDFGTGFYTTPNEQYAKRRAINITEVRNGFLDKRGLKPVVLAIDYRPPNDEQGLSCLTLKTATFDWKCFVLYNRLVPSGYTVDNTIIQNVKNGYDIVTGISADAGISNIISSIFNGTVTLEEALLLIDVSKDPDWGDCQVSFRSEQAINKCIRRIWKHWGV
ncbi:hypothetical protein SDC9_98535 [bioreactor metagenome]|uniref:PARP catalytic domain-containing protein n=1 Tax=bioreactor metagenome TaxID=1076179 RepID=A0A645AQB4_9ZZZZ